MITDLNTVVNIKLNLGSSPISVCQYTTVNIMLLISIKIVCVYTYKYLQRFQQYNFEYKKNVGIFVHIRN